MSPMPLESMERMEPLVPLRSLEQQPESLEEATL